MRYDKGERVIVTIPTASGAEEEWCTATGRKPWFEKDQLVGEFVEVLLDADSPWISSHHDDGIRIFNKRSVKPFFH
jgi:hypothetical protein